MNEEAMNEVIACLKDKDDKATYEYAKQIGMESAGSDRYLNMIPEFAKRFKRVTCQGDCTFVELNAR